MVKSMAKGKSPGIDELVVEVFHNCWHFVEDSFFDLLPHFGDPQFNEGVLKLVPTNFYWI